MPRRPRTGGRWIPDSTGAAAASYQRMWLSSLARHSVPGGAARRRQIWLPMVPEGTYRAASCPGRSPTAASSRAIVGSSPQTSSPTSAEAMAWRMAGGGRVKGSEGGSIIAASLRVAVRQSSVPNRDPHRGAMAATPLPHNDTLEIRGHIIDSMLFTRILDQVLEAHGRYEIAHLDVGRTPVDPSYARLKIYADDPARLEELVQSLMGLGMQRLETGEATLVPAEMDGVLPAGFYSWTNLETEVRVRGAWLQVENSEMDCAIVVSDRRARTVPMSDVVKGEQVVVGSQGIRVQPLDRGRAGEVFEFMSSQVSSEKPQGLIVRRVAAAIRATKERGEKILWVGGPAVVHTGAGPAVVRLIEAGYMDVLFAGNALATHDIEGALYGTSLGVNLAEGIGVE